MLIVRSKQIQAQNITKKVLNIHYKIINEHEEKKNHKSKIKIALLSSCITRTNKNCMIDENSRIVDVKTYAKYF